MEALTVVIGLIIAALSAILVAIAIYSIRPTSFEDAVPGYGTRTAAVDRPMAKATKKKTKKSAGGKQSPSGGKSAAGTDQNEPGTDEDEENDNSTSGGEQDEKSQVKTAKSKQKKAQQKQLSDEEIDLIAYSRNFSSGLTSKLASATKTGAIVGSARTKQEVVKKPKAIKETVEQVIQTTSAATVSAKPVPKDEVDSATVADVSGKSTPAQTVAAAAAAATKTASARGIGQNTGQKVAASKQESSKPPAVKESVIARSKLPASLNELPSPSRRITTSTRTSPDLNDVQIATLTAPSTGGWETKIHKGDPTVALRQQLEDKEVALRDALQQAHVVNTKYSEMKTELAVTRTKNSTLEQQAASLMSEIDALKKRLQHVHGQHVTEASSWASEEPKHHTKQDNDKDQKLKILEDALKQNAMLLNSSENARRTLESKLKQAEDQKRQTEVTLEETEQAHAVKIEQLSENLMKLEARNRSLLQELEETKVSSEPLQQQLKEKEKSLSEMENKQKVLESKIEDLTKIIESKEEELQERLSEQDRSQSDLRNEVSRLTNVCAEKDSEIELVKQELQAQLKIRENELVGQLNEAAESRNHLQSEVEHFKSILVHTEQILKGLEEKTENQERDWQQKIESGNDQLRQAQDEVKRLQDEINSLRGNGEVAINGNASCQELQELRDKLNETERRLEEERSSNERLSQKLGELNGLHHDVSADNSSS